MMRRSCSLRRRSRPPGAQTADTARLSMSAACFMDSSTLPPIGPLAASPMNDNILYHSLATRLVQVVARLPSLFHRATSELLERGEVLVNQDFKLGEGEVGVYDLKRSGSSHDPGLKSHPTAARCLSFSMAGVVICCEYIGDSFGGRALAGCGPFSFIRYRKPQTPALPL